MAPPHEEDDAATHTDQGQDDAQCYVRPVNARV
jgi:hypothetical protein